MLVDVQYRERLALYQAVTKKSQTEAANQAIGEMLERAEQDPVLKAKMDRVREIKAELAAI